MSTAHPPRNQKDRLVRRQKHDPYQSKGQTPGAIRLPSVQDGVSQGPVDVGPRPVGQSRHRVPCV